MALSDSALLIRDYDNIRDILRDVYIYGCFTKEDFVKNGISSRKYDKEQMRIKAYLPDKFIKSRRVGKKTLLYCTYNMDDSGHNFLAETYRNKSFTMLDLMSYFFVLQILGQDESMTLPEILEELPCFNEEYIFTKDNLRVKLEELVEAGLIDSVKKGKAVLYSIAVDIWEEFSNDELNEIYNYLDFKKNTSPLEIPYYFLQNKLRLYMITKRKMELLPDKVFQYKHDHIFTALDNDILLEILTAIKQKKRIKVKLRSRNNEIEFVTVPVQLIHDSTYGRQYLMVWNPDFNQSSILRIDRLIKAECGKNLSKEELDAISLCMERAANCWSTSGVNMGATEVKVEFLFDENKEGYILQRVKQEGHGGSIEKISDGRYLYSNMINDPTEMIPWLRSFGERAKVVSSGEFKIEEKIAEDWRKAVENYEALS